jgi:hypothetical protein
MSESLERQLSLIERTKLRLHLLVCAWCAQYLKQIKLLREVVGQPEFTKISSGSPKLTDEARQRISESLCKESGFTATNW